jgi:type I restriction enzyme R subunit
MTPEQKARVNIDKMLLDAGYIIQDMSEFNRSASLGVAVREYPTNSGEVDYLIFIDGEPVGVIEVKAEDKGFSLSVVEERVCFEDPRQQVGNAFADIHGGAEQDFHAV